MEKVIIENGGRVIDDYKAAMYKVQEDGFDSSIWDNQEETNKERIVHFRFIEQSVKEK
jgi:hypothetical protein